MMQNIHHNYMNIDKKMDNIQFYKIYLWEQTQKYNVSVLKLKKFLNEHKAVFLFMLDGQYGEIFLYTSLFEIKYPFKMPITLINDDSQIIKDWKNNPAQINLIYDGDYFKRVNFIGFEDECIGAIGLWRFSQYFKQEELYELDRITQQGHHAKIYNIDDIIYSIIVHVQQKVNDTMLEFIEKILKSPELRRDYRRVGTKLALFYHCILYEDIRLFNLIMEDGRINPFINNGEFFYHIKDKLFDIPYKEICDKILRKFFIIMIEDKRCEIDNDELVSLLIGTMEKSYFKIFKALLDKIVQQDVDLKTVDYVANKTYFICKTRPKFLTYLLSKVDISVDLRRKLLIYSVENAYIDMVNIFLKNDFDPSFDNNRLLRIVHEKTSTVQKFDRYYLVIHFYLMADKRVSSKINII